MLTISLVVKRMITLEPVGVNRGGAVWEYGGVGDAGYVKMDKSFVGRRPRTSYTITNEGREALQEHMHALGC